MKKQWFINVIFLFLLIFTGCSVNPASSNNGTSSSSTSAASIYSVAINGSPAAVERVSKYDVPVNYVRLNWPGSNCSVAVTVNSGSASGYTLSPLSKNISLSVSGNTITFTATEPGYLVLQSQTFGVERLFILIDPAEVSPPKPGDANVTNIMDYAGMDNTGGTLVTAVIQGAIDQASGAARNILYFPPGTYRTKTLNLKNNMTMYLADGAVLECATTSGELLANPAGYVIIEGCSQGFISMNGVINARLMGRGTIDGNGKVLKSSGRKMFLVKIEGSTNCIVEGIISRDSCFWTTLIYRSTGIAITNYKVINNRLSSTWNKPTALTLTTASTAAFTTPSSMTATTAWP